MPTRPFLHAALAALVLLTPLLGHAQLQLERVGPTPSATTVLHRGERVGFSARATSPAGGLHGSEWYLEGSYVGAQYRTALPSSTEYDATFWRSFHFPTTGRFRVATVAFDRASNYSPSATWTVDVVERPRFLYVDQTDTLLDAPQATQDAFWSFVAAQRINQLGIYRLNQILGNATRTAALRAFITRAHAAGVSRVFAIVATPANVSYVRSYLFDPATPTTARFDGLLTEHEFWNGTTSADVRWGSYLRLLSHVRVLADDAGLLAATYLGWFSAEEARSLRELVDVVLLHAYVATPANAYPYLKARLELLSREWGRPVQVWPIFSAECDFSGRWFSDNRSADPLELAENTVLDAYRADDRTFRNGLRVAGFAYFARTHLTTALGGAACAP
ncbi:hypothetical protein HPC49_11595 [Pyxidicoccus fallax]|uniref:Asl1-like glycosyl hydrolase catalytic domain-containing protein n=1 Tax=Pyxidicoccus fallax TaxID=394095 RepID=A0A848LL42_9BACT|nr:hypothetical protein [Pyxidicoccus fallax]NMO18446.1 hypothetical protein [Pyxidicoccus fallax]NPC78883.1 hypothetical protein [Pyxidicoccus fallax]